VTPCYTRSTPSYKLLSEYNLFLTQRPTSYPLELVGLSCGSFSFERVTNELPTSRTVAALRRGHLALIVVRLSSVAHLSLPTQLLESKPAAYIDNPVATWLCMLLHGAFFPFEIELEERVRVSTPLSARFSPSGREVAAIPHADRDTPPQGERQHPGDGSHPNDMKSDYASTVGHGHP
jgi:hypothetical protein